MCELINCLFTFLYDSLVFGETYIKAINLASNPNINLVVTGTLSSGTLTKFHRD